eukprot:1159928-Pelagomonas_calceolata.AAC.11
MEGTQGSHVCRPWSFLACSFLLGAEACNNALASPTLKVSLLSRGTNAEHPGLHWHPRELHGYQLSSVNGS